MNTMNDWVKRYGITGECLRDLLSIMDVPSTGIDSGRVGSEAAVQVDIRVFAATRGCSLWRNNSGSLQDATGRWVRFGLGNDSKRVNEVWKSADLIGINPVVIQPEHVGRMIGQFWAVEVKEPGWKYNDNDAHQKAQKNFLNTVNLLGGLGQFAQSVGDVSK